MEELIPTLQEEGEERIDTLAEQTIIAGVQTINGKAGDLDLKTINNTDLLTPGNINLATPTDIHNLDTAKQDKLVAGANIQIAADGKTISATDTTYSAGSGLNLTGTTFSVDTDTIATQNDIYTLQTTKQDNLTTTQLNAVNSGIDSTKVAQIATNEGDIATINGKIPTQASTSNQLADKNFVNSSVQTATANYRGSWDDWASVPTQASDYPEDYAGSHTPTVNDYMVVQDASDYTEETLEGTWRFKYTGEWDTNGKAGWLPEYQVNETPLTAAQIAAINSGITDTLVAQISTNQSNISDLSTNKLDKNTTFWGQSVQNGAVQGTLTLTESGQNATIATSGHNTADAGIKMGNSKNYVEAGVTEITLSSTTGGIKLKPKSGSSVDVMSSKITNLATPTANTDASTKKYVDDGLATKQNTLTAGTNVQITGTTISATDTTYSAGTGLTLTGTTFSVNEPAPSGFFTGNAVTESEGTAITIPNALGTSIKDVQLKGDTSQITYTGKNLWGGFASSFSKSFNGIDYVTNTDGTISVGAGTVSGGTSYSLSSAEARNNHFVVTLPAGTYTISGSVGSVSVATIRSDNGALIAMSENGVKASFTLTEETGTFVRANIVNGQTVSAVVLKPMLNSGVQPGDYEPYTGSTPTQLQPSPNPDYPQAVNVVTGRQTVKIVPEQKNIADPQTFIDWIERTYNLCVQYNWGTDGTNRPDYGEYQNRSHVMRIAASTLYSKRNDMVNPTYDEARAIYTGIFKPNTVYTVSMDIYATGANGAVNLKFAYTDGTEVAFTRASSSNTWVSISSTSASGKTLNAIQLTYSDGMNFIDLDTFQIEEGTTKTAYTPFIGQSYEINLGKNLFDYQNIVTLAMGVGTLFSSGEYRSSYIRVQAGKTYTISRTSTSSPNRFRISFTKDEPASGVAYYNEAGETGSVNNIINADSETQHTFTVPNEMNYALIYLSNSSQTITESMGIQVELGTQATTYSAYFTPIELCKIGTYQDYIYKANGNWYKHAEIGKVDLSDVSGGYVTSTLWRTTNISDVQYVSKNTDVGFGIAEKYIMRMASGISGAGALYHMAIDTAQVSVNTGGNAVHPSGLFYYALATATDTQITNADLISQLEALASAQLATGINYINSSGVSPNLDAILTVESFNNNWNGLSQALLGA